MALELPLGRVQRWMQDVVVHPGPVDEAIAAAAGQLPPERLPEVVLPSRSLAPSERVGIYQGMYLLRMEEALESDYPALKRFLGPRGFRALVRDYVASFPSRSYTLNRLGDHLPEFVLRAGGLRHRAFGHDLARLELALTQVFDEAETPPIRPEAVAAVPEDQWPSARLRPIAAFRLLALRHPVNAYIETLRDKRRRRPRVHRKDGWVVVFRRDYSVYRLELSRAAHGLLSELAAGRPLGAAVTSAVRQHGRRAASETALYRWFRQWMASGMFRAVDLGLEGLEPSANRL